MNSAGSSLGSEFHTSQGLPVDDGPHPRCRLGCPLRPCPGQLGVPQCPPLSTPQLLLTSPLSFLFPIIFLEIVLLAAPLPGQLALLPLSRAGGGRSPAPPPRGEAPQSLCERGAGAGGVSGGAAPRPSPRSSVGVVWLPLHPQSQAVSIFNCARPPCTSPKVLSLVT